MQCFVDRATKKTVALIPLCEKSLPDWLNRHGERYKAWVEASHYEAKAGSVLLLPGNDGVDTALVGVDDEEPIWSWGGVVAKLSAGRYRIDADKDGAAANAATLGWALGQYRFDRYRKSEEGLRELIWPVEADREFVKAQASAIYLTRDLVNTPSSDMGPRELADTAKELAKEFGGEVSIIKGKDLLKENFPMIHAVGRASSRDPRLIDLTWGEPTAPKVTLVGKGVCFDSGGLDLKPASGMLMMKKDMGGSAQVLGLARMIMATGLDVRLRVLISAVENAVSGNAYRPMDILTARNGKTVEIYNTDAEGRLVLADALVLASEDKPEVIFDFATLTGAARVALGTEMPALFTNSDQLAGEVLQFSTSDSDPLWRMPLFASYRKLLDSKTADISNCSSGPYGGSITAALFLQEFVGEDIDWAHIDLMSWNLSARDGRPEGGEAQGIRAVYSYIANRFG